MQFRKIIITAAASTLLLLEGCAYRADLDQGNYVEQEAVDQLRYGMSAEQVRFLLGTPMVLDPFDSSRWYYVHFHRSGWSDPEIKNLIVMFQGATLIDMSGDFTKPAAFYSGVSDITKVGLDTAVLDLQGSQSGDQSIEAVSNDGLLEDDYPEDIFIDEEQPALDQP